MVGDEARAIEPLATPWIAVPGFEAGAVGAHHRDDVGNRVALHGAAPGKSGVEAGIVWFRADGGGVQKRLGPHQGHRPGGLRVPLVPTDADAGTPVAAVRDL